MAEYSDTPEGRALGSLSIGASGESYAGRYAAGGSTDAKINIPGVPEHMQQEVYNILNDPNRSLQDKQQAILELTRPSGGGTRADGIDPDASFNLRQQLNEEVKANEKKADEKLDSEKDKDEAAPATGSELPSMTDPAAILDQKRLIIAELNRRNSGGEGDATAPSGSGDTLVSPQISALSDKQLALLVEMIDSGVAVGPGTIADVQAIEDGGDSSNYDAIIDSAPLSDDQKQAMKDGLATASESEELPLQAANATAAEWQLELDKLSEPQTLADAEAGGPTVFGQLDSNGRMTTAEGTLLYDPEIAAEKMLGEMDGDQIIDLRENLYFAGYGDVLVEDELAAMRDDTLMTALKSAMRTVNMQGGGEEVDVMLQRLADKALNERGGVPLNKDEETYDSAGDQLRKWAKANGVGLSRGYIDRVIFDMATSQDTEGVYAEEQQKIRDTLMAKWYPKYADQFAAGNDVTDIVAPYKETMAEMLDLDPNTISMDDPYLTSIMQEDKDVTMNQFKNAIRKDERYQYSDYAYQEVDQAVQGLKSMMGL